MPGILYHLIFAEKIFPHLYTTNQSTKLDFLSGNIIPDLATNKQQSHYRKSASVSGFLVPNLKLAERELFIKSSPLKLGMYCHLYLDYHFIEEFLIPEFIWDNENDKVIHPKNNRQWDAKFFFSPDGMHSAYTEANIRLIQDNRISLSTIDAIPALLPNINMPVFDNRHKKSWKEELKSYLALSKEYTGEFFDYDKLWEFIEKISEKFISEFSCKKIT